MYMYFHLFNIDLMNRKELERTLSGGDLRSVRQNKAILPLVKDQYTFDELFHCMYSHDRLVSMRAADAIEKITRTQQQFLAGHNERLFALARTAFNKELKWHLAALLPRLSMTDSERKHAWNMLMEWANDPDNSKIVRVNAIQALFDIARANPSYMQHFYNAILLLKEEGIPSINVRIRIIMEELEN